MKTQMPYASIAVFAAIYGAVLVAWGLPSLVAFAYLAASAVCFAVYGVDKSAARAGRRRTSEKTLLLLGLCCGWPGAVLAQQWLRHKSSKASFRARFRVTVLLNVGAFICLAWPGTRSAFIPAFIPEFIP